MTEVYSSTPKRQFKKVAILFSGGPAPAANAVISTAAASFLRRGTEVVGIKHGYSNLEKYDPATPLVAGPEDAAAHAKHRRDLDGDGTSQPR
jgi:hypothetical protein